MIGSKRVFIFCNKTLAIITKLPLKTYLYADLILPALIFFHIIVQQSRFKKKKKNMDYQF